MENNDHNSSKLSKGPRNKRELGAVIEGRRPCRQDEQVQCGTIDVNLQQYMGTGVRKAKFTQGLLVVKVYCDLVEC